MNEISNKEELINNYGNETNEEFNNGFQFVELEFCDILGNPKVIQLTKDSFEKSKNSGIWFDGSSVKGFKEIYDSDMYLKPNLNNNFILQNESGALVKRVFCDVYSKENLLHSCSPRTILKQTLDKARVKGFNLKVGPEIEFFLVEKKGDKIVPPSFDYNGSYLDHQVKDKSNEIRLEILNNLKSIGLPVDKAHHEVGTGQHEIGLEYGDPLITADRIMIMKEVIRTVAQKHSLLATFMPKPFSKCAGSGMHIHFSLEDLSGNSLFYNPIDQLHLSNLARNFIQAQLFFAKEMALILNPCINSYKRLVPDHEAPVYICWGVGNRSALIRVPISSIVANHHTHAEIRSPDGLCSPYLAFAALLHVGLEGIDKKLDIMKDTNTNVFKENALDLSKKGITTLPTSLFESITYFKQSQLMLNMLGESYFKRYIDIKEKEWQNYNQLIVTDWEIENYLFA
ncbi:MAG TPA: glutamine synthetase family protein [Candidatus Woesearchaeota archaeon]|nr:glutamine synthetase family protein [Candidatus Woesearchaeota archaeon]